MRRRSFSLLQLIGNDEVQVCPEARSACGLEQRRRAARRLAGEEPAKGKVGNMVPPVLGAPRERLRCPRQANTSQVGSVDAGSYIRSVLY